MMSSTAIGWSAMGKPDFSQAAKLFYRLPADLREGMNRSEEKTLIWAIFLTWWHGVHSGRQQALASFSETWLGTKFGRSRWTVARALAKLEGFALLKRIRRSPKKDGTYQTNLIALGARLNALFAIQTTQPRDKSPCSKTAPQGTRSEYKQERAATFGQSAASSLSSFISDSARERTANTEKEEKQVEPGTLMKLFLKAREEKAG